MLKKLIRHHYYKGYPSGLGDYFRSGIIAYKYYEMSYTPEGQKCDYSFFFEGHPLDKYMKAPEMDKKIYENDGILRTNSYELFSKVHIDEKDKKQFKKMIDDAVVSSVHKQVAKEYKRYPHEIAIHCRTGDQLCKSLKNPHVRICEYETALKTIINLRRNIDSSLKIRLFTDNLELRERVKMTGLDICTGVGDISHTAYDEKDTKDTLVDFLLMMKSSMIYTFLSTNDHRRFLSTFSFFPAYLCNIPIRVVYKDAYNDVKCDEVYSHVLFENDYFAEKFVVDADYTKHVIKQPYVRLE